MTVLEGVRRGCLGGGSWDEVVGFAGAAGPESGGGGENLLGGVGVAAEQGVGGEAGVVEEGGEGGVGSDFDDVGDA
ncbi:hypothetical protein ACGFMK_42195, partial [Amycolatopsis sp. NPDC049252]